MRRITPHRGRSATLGPRPTGPAIALACALATSALATGTQTDAATAPPTDSEVVAAVQAELDGIPAGCDPIDPRHCFLPFPSNALTTPDTTSDTGRRVAFPMDGAPVNAQGVRVDMTAWNRSDGFSPSTTMLAYVASLDDTTTNLPTWTDLERSLADDAAVVVVDVDTGERIPLWAELDTQAADGADRMLVIHPAITLTEGHTYAVGLRDLMTTAGAPVEPSASFTAIRDELDTGIDLIDDRRSELQPAFDALADAGVDRGELQLAWDFTVASTRNLTERMLHIRDETLAALGDAAPPFTATIVDAPTNSDGERIEGIARTVTGTFTVTNWLTGDGSAGNGFNPPPDASGVDWLPAANGTVEVTYACNIPDVVMAGPEPGRLVQYGHGLLGSERELNAGNLRTFGNDYATVTCATKWAGMSEDDIGNAVASLTDMSNFSTLTDRLQQGVLNQLVLTRLMQAPDGLAADPAFQRMDASPVFDRASVVYDGNSQGGIMGVMLAAVSPDIERFVLGVPGINYGLLLPRSIDFTEYEAVFEPAYPSDFDRTLLIAMIQMLWDRGEGAGYVNHVTADPLPDTPTKTVLMHVALGDQQVSELSALIAARTMHVPIHHPTPEGRSLSVDLGWGLAPIVYPSDGSGLVIWDSGAQPIPFENLPPTAGEDPHGDPRADPAAQAQKASFLFDEILIDVCDAAACTAAAA